MNGHNSTSSRRRSRNWSLGSNFDLLDSNTVSENNYLRRNTSNSSLDIAASIFSSLQELPPNRSISSTSALNSLGIQVGGASMADYDYGSLVGNNGNGFGIGMIVAEKERTRPVSAVGLNLDSLYEPELRAGKYAAGRLTGQGNRSLATTMQTSDAASALRRIEMEERLLQQPYHDLEEQHHRQMKEILRLQQQQNLILSNESRKTMMNTQGWYTPVQSLSPQQPDHQRLHHSQQLLMQEQLRYQNQSRKQSVPPSRWPSSQSSSRLTDFSTEELFQEVSRRRGETSSVPNFSGAGVGGTERGGARGAMDSMHILTSKIGQRNEVNDHNVMNTALRGGTSEVVRCRQLKSSSEMIRPAEMFPPSSERGMVGRLQNLIAGAPPNTTDAFPKSVDEATNSSVVSSSTYNVEIEDKANYGNQDSPRRKRIRDRNTSFDTLLSVFGDELAELDREESGKRNPKEAATLSGSVGTITMDDFIVGASGDEASDEYESSSNRKAPSTDISPINNAQIFGANNPQPKTSRTIEESPVFASMDAMTIDSIVRERALHQMHIDMRDHLVRTTGFGRGSSSIPSSLSSTSNTAQAYLAELKGLVLPPPPLAQSTMTMGSAHHQPHQERRIPPPTTAKVPTHHPPPLERTDPKVALQQFLDKYGEAAQTSRTDLLNAISETEKSLVTIHNWDRSQGLRKCHSRTVVKTRRSRAKVKAFLLGVDPPKELVKRTQRKKESG